METKSTSLMEVTIALLKQDDRSLPQVTRETKIPLSWLKKFIANDFKNPSVNRVQYLYEFLSGKNLIN